MKWKKVSEHPLPEGDREKEYLLKAYFGTHYITKYPKSLDGIIEWCEFNPDEIESGDQFEDGENAVHKLFHSNGEPSWEEKFRCDVVRDMLKHYVTVVSDIDFIVQASVEIANKTTAELKRGRE